MVTSERRISIGPGEGETLRLKGGVGVVYKVNAEETGGAFAIVEHPVPPAAFAPPHTHTREDELSYVLEGEITVMIGRDTFVASAGAFVFKPRDVPHAFWNASSGHARLLEIIWPPALAGAFREMAQAEASPDFRELFDSISRRYGVRGNPELMPELHERYGLKRP